MYEIFLGNFFWVIILCLDRPRATKIGTYLGTRQRQRHSTRLITINHTRPFPSNRPPHPSHNALPWIDTFTESKPVPIRHNYAAVDHPLAVHGKRHYRYIDYHVARPVGASPSRHAGEGCCDVTRDDVTRDRPRSAAEDQHCRNVRPVRDLASFCKHWSIKWWSSINLKKIVAWPTQNGWRLVIIR